MDQDTKTYGPPAGADTPICGQRQPGDDYVCTSARGHEPLDHAAYESEAPGAVPASTWPVLPAAPAVPGAPDDERVRQMHRAGATITQIAARLLITPEAARQAIDDGPPPFSQQLAILSTGQLECLHAHLNVAWSELRELRWGTAADRDDPRRAGWDEVWDEISGLQGDELDARPIAREREIGAERIARANRSNHLDAIAEAEQLLAAERTAGAA